VWNSLYDVAGGWYIGQFAIMYGFYSGGAWGSITGAGNLPKGAGFDCPSGSIDGLKTNYSSQPGDSGGTVALLYDNKLFLAGIHTGSLGSEKAVSWIGYIPTPIGGHICVQVNPC
jgi:hypothetical protein